MGKKNNAPAPAAGGDAKDNKPAEAAKQGGGGGGGGGGGASGKKDNGPITVVLKVDMHCDGCTKKIRNSVRGFPGVEAVSTDVAAGNLTVIGKLDPVKLRDRMASKTHKTVVIVSPVPPKGKDAGGEKPAGGGKLPAADTKDAKKGPKEPAVTTVVLKMRLHCAGCIQRIRRTVLKVKGAEQVTVDEGKELVTVKGTMDVKRLQEILKKKMKREVEVVPPPKKEVKKESCGGGAAEKKADDAAKKAADEEKKKMLEYYERYGYHVELVHAPMLFSEENPNACSIM